MQYPRGPVVNTDPETVYISGPISGDLVGNIPAFFEMEAELLAQGHRVFNPARIGGADNAREAIEMAMSHPERDWIWYMRRSYAGLVMCSMIVMLPGWENSQGAKAENYVARSLMFPSHELIS
jgi:hypothetical protein